MRIGYYHLIFRLLFRLALGPLQYGARLGEGLAITEVTDKDV